MSIPSLILIAAAVACAAWTLNPRLLRNTRWRATVTPLASIIGSGFLVAGPILAHAAGNLAWAGMLALCAAGYLFGMAIRRNIEFVEPIMAQAAPPGIVRILERGSELALALAYFISVAYYLNLFAAFGLRALGIVDPLLIRSVSSAVIIALGAIGLWRGLSGMENVETGAVGLKLALIGGLLAALVGSTVLALGSATGLTLNSIPHVGGWHEIGVLLGLVILVQGFETSRYLGAGYDGPTRIRTMRRAQLLSTAIYMAFVLLITPFFTGRLPPMGGETAIIDMLQPLGAAVAPAIIVMALASQLSAAVADMNGAGGLVASGSGRRIGISAGMAATAAVALTITWIADIYQIIVYASKAFVLYYALQSVLAVYVALFPRRAGVGPDAAGAARNGALAALFAAGTVLALLVLAFGVPAEGGS